MNKRQISRIGLSGIMVIGWLLGMAPGALSNSSPPPGAKTPAKPAVQPVAPVPAAAAPGAGAAPVAATGAAPGTPPSPGTPGPPASPVTPPTPAPPATVSPAPPAAAAAPPSLSTLPNKAVWGGFLAIVADQDHTFDLQPGNNEVTFRLPEAKDHPEKAIQVSPDGRTILVQVPMQALPGLKRVENKKKNKDYGPVDLNIIPGESVGNLYFWWVLLPAVFFLIIFGVIVRALKKDDKWSLGKAMSEQLEQKVLHVDETDPKKPVVYNPTTHEPVYDFKYVESSSASRLIAFVGFLTLIVWFLAMLIPALYWFGRTGEVPNLGNLSTFLGAQATVFAPYIANKVASAISGK